MESFCNGTPFWDLNLTWYGDWPQFTECFQDTILIWVTNGWLWITAPLYIGYMVTQPTARGAWSWITYLKMVITILLLALVVINIVTVVDDLKTENAYWRANLVGPFIEGVTLLLVLIYIPVERYKGFVTSGVLFIYWTIAIVTSVIPFYSKIIQKEYETKLLQFVAFMIYFGLLVIQWVVHCIAEKLPHSKNVCPEQRSSFLSRLTFNWITRMMIQGYKRPLVEDDMFELNDRDLCRNAYNRFLKNWSKELAIKRPQYSKSLLQQSHVQDEASESTPLLNPKVVIKKSSPQKKKLSLFKVLAKTFGWELLHAHIFKLFYDVTIFISPFLLRLLIDYTSASKNVDGSSEFQQEWKGYTLAAAFFVTILIQSLSFHQQFYWGMSLGMRVKAALTSAVYRKALTLTSESRKESTVGEIVNLMSIDTQHIQDTLNYLWAVWSSPLQIGFSLYFLYTTVGPSMFAGFGILVLLLPINGVIMSVIHKLQEQQMTQKDNRIKVLTEVLNGIKILKLYAWEMSFKDKILAIRDLELKILFKASVIGIGFTFSWTIAPYLVSLATFGTYVLVSSDHYLDAQKAFVAISLFNILRFAINFAPMAITETIKASVSIKRLNNFLSHDELDPDNVLHDFSKDDAIVIHNGTFMWDPAIGNCLKNIDLSVPENSLVAVVGQVGSGKSSLMSAILGDMTKISGNVNVKGTQGYVPQQAWIQNSSVQDNILFGREMDQGLYDRIIDACALRPDLDILPAGDSTEIGEKGINLSGGQKQRVSLARAVYHDADIYLLDDPLSAVDSNVGKHIFDQVISKDGLLKDKTRVLVTHGVRWLPMADKIIVMMDGVVSEMGSYEELLSHDGAFAQFLKMYLIQSEDEEEVDPEEKEIKAKILQRLTSITSDDESDRVLSENEEKTILKRLISKDLSDPKSPEHQRLKSKEEVIKADDKKPAGDSKLITDEKLMEGNVSWGVFVTYAKALGVPYTLTVLLLFSFYEAAAVFANIWLSEWTSDETLTNRSLGPPNSSIYRDRNDYYLGIYGGAGAAQAIFVFTYVSIFVVQSIAASRKLHHKMLRSIIRSPMSFFDTTPIGRIVNRFSADIDTIDNELPMTVEMFMDTAFLVVATMVVISYSTPLFIILIVPFGILYFLIQRFYVSTSRQLKRLQSKTRSPIYNHFGETVSGASVIRAYGAQDRFIDINDERVDLNQKFVYAGITANRWLGVRLEFIGNIIIFSAAMFAVVARGSIDAAIVGLSISYALQITENLNWLVRVTSDLETNVVSVERVNEYSVIQEEANLITNYRPLPNWPTDGVIEFNKYSTRYRDGLDLVLKGIDTKINAGEKVGIVGRTGAGKSSLTLALFRLIEPVSGSIVVDGENLYHMGLHDCRSKLTILPQDPVLFSGSLRMNLDPLEEHKDTEIWKALEHAHLKDFIQNLPQKLEYDCGEGGQNLSVGQRQLVCLARSLLRKTKILVLDEATAAVDMETDDLIQQTIRQEFAECTVVTIAHRLNTVMDYDRIMVLDKGEIKEFDSPNELLKKTDGLFYQLAKDAGIV